MLIFIPEALYFSDSFRTRDICDGLILITEIPFARFDDKSSSSLIFCGRCLALPDGRGAAELVSVLLLELSKVAHESRLETAVGSMSNPSSSSFIRSPQSAVFCGVETSAFSGDFAATVSGDVVLRGCEDAFFTSFNL